MDLEIIGQPQNTNSISKTIICDITESELKESIEKTKVDVTTSLEGNTIKLTSTTKCKKRK